MLRALNYGHLVQDKVEEDSKVKYEGIVESASKIASLYEELPVPTNDIRESLKKWEQKNADFRKDMFTKYIKKDSDKKTQKNSKLFTTQAKLGLFHFSQGSLHVAKRGPGYHAFPATLHQQAAHRLCHPGQSAHQPRSRRQLITRLGAKR